MSQGQPNCIALVVIDDLIFETKIRSTAAELGVEVRCVKSFAEARMALDGDQPGLVIVDLNSAGGAALEVVKAGASRPQPPRILAFASHVDRELARAALDSGADQVVPRSRFSAELPRLLEELLERASKDDQ